MNNQQDTRHSTAHQTVGGQNHSPSRAAVATVIPSIGAVYNRDYIKAVVHFAVFAGLLIIGESVEPFQMAAFVFYIFTVIDAYRSAEAIARRTPDPHVEDTLDGISFPLWGGALILMGIVFLLDSLDVFRVKAIVKFWPLVFIGLGSYLIFDYLRALRRSRKEGPTSQEVPSGPPIPPTPPIPEKNHHGQETD